MKGIGISVAYVMWQVCVSVFQFDRMYDALDGWLVVKQLSTV